MQVGHGKQLEIEVKRNDPKDVYVQSFKLNGQRQSKAWFRHADIATGGRMELVMGPEPNQSFGSEQADLPPSLTL